MVELIFWMVLISNSLEMYSENERNIGGRIKPQGLVLAVDIYTYIFYSRLGFTANPHNAGRTSSNSSQVFFSFLSFGLSFFFSWKEAHTCIFTRDRLIKILWRTGFSVASDLRMQNGSRKFKYANESC